MTVQTQTLDEFLLARIARDEAAAREAMGDTSGKWASWNHRAHSLDLRDLAVDGQRIAELPLGPDEHIARWDPARVLAECEAKRRIVELHRIGHDPCDAHDAMFLSIPCETLEVLALPYAHHPDYREEWRP